MNEGRKLAGLFACGMLLCLVARAQPVAGEVVSVGFEANTNTRYVVREGQYVPVLVRLRSQSADPVQCRLTIERSDVDGDRIDYEQALVALTPDAGARKVWCYAATLRQDASAPLLVDVRDESGELLARLAAPAFDVVSNDYELILDISEKPVQLLRRLDAETGSYMARRLGERQFVQDYCVARLPAADLPDRWFGLESVDVLVWDEPSPDSLTSWQLAALVEWVRRGGQLVLGVGRSWPRIREGELAELLPIRGDAATIELDDLPVFRGKFLSGGGARLDGPIAAAIGERVAGAAASVVDLARGRPFDLITQRQFGSGRVTVVATTLLDLARFGEAPALLPELVDVSPLTNEYRKSESEQLNLLAQSFAMYAPVMEGVEFRAQASLRVLGAFAFVAAYIGLSTFASWWWLQRRQLTHLSWTVFAVFALAAGALSLGAAALSRGVTDVMDSVSFVDLDAGSSDAQGTSYFGLRSARRQRVELLAPGDAAYVRPLASGPEPPGTYATAERYAASLSDGGLSQTPLRATLKQFESRWRTPIEGMIRGDLVASRETGRIDPKSWIQNDLPAPVGPGWLLYIDPRLEGRDGVPHRVAGLTSRTDRNAVFQSAIVPAAFNVLAVSVEAMSPSARIGRLGEPDYAAFDRALDRWSQSGADPLTEPVLPTLWSAQNVSWVSAFQTQLTWQARVAPPVAAMLLASTRGLYLPAREENRFDRTGATITVDGLLDADVTHWLTQGQAVLLLPSESPTPSLTLTKDGEPQRVRSGRTLYRVRMPIAYVGRPPAGSAP